jgi:hypothetical protein
MPRANQKNLTVWTSQYIKAHDGFGSPACALFSMRSVPKHGTHIARDHPSEGQRSIPVKRMMQEARFEGNCTSLSSISNLYQIMATSKLTGELARVGSRFETLGR